MEKQMIQPWIAVNSFMDDEYREIVVELAWKQLPQASPELRKFAKSVFANIGEIRGFRSVLKAPPKLALRLITEKFKENPLVAIAIICLWAEAVDRLIQAFRCAAEMAGIRFVPDWRWENASQGFLAYEEIRELKEFSESYTSEMEHHERNHVMLATLWLGRAIISEPVIEYKDTENQETSIPEIEIPTETSPQTTSKEEVKQDLLTIGAQMELPPQIAVETTKPDPVSIGEAKTLPKEEQSIRVEDSEELPMTLSDIEEVLNLQLEKANQSQQAMISGVNSLLVAAQDAQLNLVELNLGIVQKFFTNWQTEEMGLGDIIDRTIETLTNEVASRPDLSLDISLESMFSEAEFIKSQPSTRAEALLSVIQSIHAYDKTSQETLSQIEDLQAKIAKIQDELAIWESFNSVGADVITKTGKEEELTLTQLKDLHKEILSQYKTIKKHQAQFRELCVNRINNLVGRLKELETSNETLVSGEYTLGSLTSLDLHALESQTLRSIEVALVDLLNARLAEVKSVDIAALASELRDKWDDTGFVRLLESLAKQNRDIEMFLLLIASNSIHPKSEPLVLKRPVVRGLLSGLGQLSHKSRPFALLSNIAPQFIQGWETSDPTSKSELCLLFLAARRGGDYLIPVELLWEVAYEWPLPNLNNWNRLWRAEIMNESLTIFTHSEEDYQDPIQQARSAIDHLFAREHGFYVRLNSIKSSRHRSMLNTEIMPWLNELINRISKYNEALQKAETHTLEKLLSQLEKFVCDELPHRVDESALLERYEKGVVDAGIDDSDPFHRRTSTHFLQECAENIQAYGDAILNYWKWRLQSQEGVTKIALQSELDGISGLSTLSQAALEQIVATAEYTLPEWDPEQSELHAIQYLEQELLSQPVYTIRLPRLIGCLTSERFGWSQVLENILDDLAEPLDFTGIANYLLEQESPNHSLFLTHYIPLEAQKRALLHKMELEKEIEQLQTDLLHLGGSADDLRLHKDLGRWRLLRQEMSTRIGLQRSMLETQKQRSLDQVRKLRAAITNLDDEIFEIRETIPIDARQIIEEGLALAKKSCEKDSHVPYIQAYLDEIRYRLTHESWPIVELQDSYDELYRRVMEESIAPDVELTSEKVLEYFEQGDLKPLGIGPMDIPTSSIGTRIDLLRNWITLRTTSSFLNEDLKVPERNAIHSLFRSFSKMMAMRRTLDPQGQPITSEHPVIFSYYDLQYPKTAVLDNHCIFIVLPGYPPTAENLKNLELILEDKQWLEYFFVFLFIPGCTPKIRHRLHTSYRKQGLVIIDTPAIIQMVLAEKFERNPVGILRPLMLNALEADNVDVFKINQLVDNYSAIFVGRDREVERYASREGNYAIYGGRRIGKSSVIKAVEKLLLHRGVRVIYHSFEGQADCSDDHSALLLTQLLNLTEPVQICGDLKFALQSFMDENPGTSLVILLDEIDRYIETNRKRHVLIETMRSLSERYGSRFRVVISGFMNLYDCLNGRGPYSPASDPWGRMLNDSGPLENLRPVKAEDIVKEGFLNILGWSFESRAIPQRIVELTGGHPAFVQNFCLKLQQRVGVRGDKLVRLDDIQAVFSDRDPEQSFIAYVRKTLEMNLDPIGHYLILLLALESKDKKGFTFDEMLDYANTDEISIPEKLLERSLERLKVTSVVKEVTSRVYEFSVPDYPSILIELGENVHMERLEQEVIDYLKRGSSA